MNKKKPWKEDEIISIASIYTGLSIYIFTMQKTMYRQNNRSAALIALISPGLLIGTSMICFKAGMALVNHI